eukprot:CAMPEP_0113498444 /NCGR_PEP_ID=MMETSP0014_2-20120614/31182_1 /TAXON_ID=2857 /ORGANISM="Nitzschia sp." /LENGTH=769 /DNA_ID=CAMNT_0000392481 /DNA_START=92 /DNA_END=2404 /DNA_ORIENTATION=- /assembly_acc=CAM_ASM_000159
MVIRIPSPSSSSSSSSNKSKNKNNNAGGRGGSNGSGGRGDRRRSRPGTAKILTLFVVFIVGTVLQFTSEVPALRSLLLLGQQQDQQQQQTAKEYNGVNSSSSSSYNSYTMSMVHATAASASEAVSSLAEYVTDAVAAAVVPITTSTVFSGSIFGGASSQQQQQQDDEAIEAIEILDRPPSDTELESQSVTEFCVPWSSQVTGDDVTMKPDYHVVVVHRDDAGTGTDTTHGTTPGSNNNKDANVVVVDDMDDDMDEWWLHHVEWDVDVTRQTSQRQCFIRRYGYHLLSSSSEEDGSSSSSTSIPPSPPPPPQTTPDTVVSTNDFLTKLHRRQFNPSQNCSDVSYRTFQSGGYGANVYALVKVFLSVFQGGKSLRLSRYKPGAPWSYTWYSSGPDHNNVTLACPEKDMSCYFLPINHCALPATTNVTKLDNGTSIIHQELPPDIIGYQDNIPDAGRPVYLMRRWEQYTPWFVWYLTRPQQWMRYKVQKYLQHRMVNYHEVTKRLEERRRRTRRRKGRDHDDEDDGDNYDDEGDLCTVLHVRRTDIMLDRDERHYYPLVDYLNVIPNRTDETTATTSSSSSNNTTTAAADSLQGRKEPPPKLVVVLTDDASTIDEFPLFDAKDYMFVYSNKTRFRGTEGGHSNHVPTHDPVDEFVCMLAEFQIAQMCGKTLIGTRSGYLTLIKDYMSVGNFNYYHPDLKHINSTSTELAATIGDGAKPGTTLNEINLIRIDTLNETKGARIMEKEFFEAHQERLKQVKQNTTTNNDTATTQQ